jgi:uncharacterized protein YyaL (SSP411 family)
MIQGLLELFQADSQPMWLEWAIALQRRQDELFWDEEAGGWFSTTGQDPSVLLRMKEDYDGAEPSGNSVALMNLQRLSHMTDRQDFRESAERLLGFFAPRLSVAPVALPYMLAGVEFRLGDPRQIILAGEDLHPLTRALYTRFVPSKIVLAAQSPEAREQLAAWIPPIAEMRAVENRATAYVCRNYTCQLPVTGTDEFLGLLQ